MNYVKSCLIVTMLLGALYACGSEEDLGTEAGCGGGQICMACCDLGGGQDVFWCSASESTCVDMGGTWNGISPCPDIEPDGCNESNWQEYYPHMIYCDLEEANLDYANLSYANLYMANLAGADLEGANLDYANLMYANLSGADLYWAWLGHTNLHMANLAGADLAEAHCSGAFFVGANLEGTIFDDAFLAYAYFDENYDGYDDVSFDAGFSAGAGADYADGYDAGEASVDTQSYYDAGAESVDVGDMNDDGTNNVLDVVILVNNILNP